MKLDLSALRYLSTDDFRVLTAVEMGMRNHEIVPVELIESIAKLKRGNSNKVIANLLKHKLVEHSNIKYDGYSLNFMGYDYLAIHTLMKRGILIKVGPKLGVGKESDVHICYVSAQYVKDKQIKEISDDEYNKLKENIFEEKNEDEVNTDEVNNSNEEEDVIDNGLHNYSMMNKFEEELQVLDVQCHIAIIKIARLGRTSFRAIKNKRDYVKNKTHYNWLYLSRVSATNEFKFLSGLYENNFSVPKPYDQNRHVILMQYIPSYPLCRIDDIGDKEKAYNDLISIIILLATKGLLHGDFNEFNILVEATSQKIYFIDFPQMISVAHQDAEKYFYRDLECINKFFRKKFGITFDNTTVDFQELIKNRADYLDVKLKAYGYDIVLHNLQDEEKRKLEALRIEEESEGEEDEFEAELNKSAELDLDYDKEINTIVNDDLKTSNLDKIEIDCKDIRFKVKKLLLKNTSKHVSRKAKKPKDS